MRESVVVRFAVVGHVVIPGWLEACDEVLVRSRVGYEDEAGYDWSRISEKDGGNWRQRTETNDREDLDHAEPIFDSSVTPGAKSTNEDGEKKLE